MCKNANYDGQITQKRTQRNGFEQFGETKFVYIIIYSRTIKIV